jgi:hypothetical protein
LQTNPVPNMNPSNPPTCRALGYKSRHIARLSNVPLLGRSALMSQFQQDSSLTPPDSQFPKLLAFFQFWKWIFPYRGRQEPPKRRQRLEYRRRQEICSAVKYGFIAGMALFALFAFISLATSKPNEDPPMLHQCGRFIFHLETRTSPTYPLIEDNSISQGGPRVVSHGSNR